jgi:RNAse (barnase) inhibitor barstar
LKNIDLQETLSNSSEKAVEIFSSNSLGKNQLFELMENLEYKYFQLNGLEIKSKNDLLSHLARVLMFPDYFGNNWDALEECLLDLGWIPANGYVLLFSHPENFVTNSLEDFKIFKEIITSASKYWSSQKIRFILIFEVDNEIGLSNYLKSLF